MAVTLYLECFGFRRIMRILSEMFEKYFCYHTVILWIKKEAKNIGSSKVEAQKEIQIEHFTARRLWNEAKWYNNYVVCFL